MGNICSICSKKDKYVKNNTSRDDLEVTKKGSSRTAKAKTENGKPDPVRSETSDKVLDPDPRVHHVYEESSQGYPKNQNKGSPTVNNKNTVGRDHTIIAERATNCTINYYGSSEPVQKTRYEPYCNKKPDNACYVYTPEASGGRVEDIGDVHLIATWEKSVCRIQYPKGSGSGFRVGTGDKFLLCTANHIAKAMMGIEPDRASSVFDHANNNPESQLDTEDVWCVFNHLHDCNNVTDRDKFYFKPVRHFFDEETDIAILELKSNRFGTEMPPAFTVFDTPHAGIREFNLIGHPDGGKKRRCKSENFINMSSSKIKDLIREVRQWHEDRQRVCERHPNNILDNPSRWLFHVTDSFNKGASGGPGLVLKSNLSISVVTVLLRGYPDWFYDPDIHRQRRADLPEEFRVEQGANMEFVYKNMKRDNPKLCREIFNQ